MHLGKSGIWLFLICPKKTAFTDPLIINKTKSPKYADVTNDGFNYTVSLHSSKKGLNLND